ncbi:MAG: MBL fold metallo-hydrolase [Succinivibrio sp.]|nr:MBL fold metallo-hydrolase [Succinivibrio sp.]
MSTKIVLSVLLLLALAGGISWYVFCLRPQLDLAPSEQRARLIQSSPHYQNGAFVPSEPIVNKIKGSGLKAWWDFLFGSREELQPEKPLPSKRTDLLSLKPQEQVLVWLGHSTFLVQSGGYRLLADPILSGHASPFSFMIKAFPGSDIYRPEDFPQLDVLIISHDHWDHLDYPTLRALVGKVKQVVCPLGIGEYFERWGYAREIIHELDWQQSVSLADDLQLTLLPARHFSGRAFSPNQTLTCSYALKLGSARIFYSGDGGYGRHFAQIGEQYGPFDLAVLEDGQYDEQWPNVHMFPEEVARAAEELHAKALIPVHNSKFVMANHSWREPLDRLLKSSERASYRLLTPLIGQSVPYLDEDFVTERWWLNLK